MKYREKKIYKTIGAMVIVGVFIALATSDPQMAEAGFLIGLKMPLEDA